jgi:transposase InsO family protein
MLIKDGKRYFGDREVIFVEDREALLQSLWDDPETRVLSRDRFYRSLIAPKYVGISVKDVDKFLKEHEAYQLSKRLTKGGTIKPIIETEPNGRWQIDLIDMGSDPKVIYANKRYCWIMTVIDVFSRYLFALPLKNKEATTTKAVLEALFKSGFKPRKIQSDNGKEFLGEYADYCEEQGVKLIHSRSHTPQSQGLVERTNQTLKRLLHMHEVETGSVVWVDILPSVIRSYNNTFSDQIGCTPNEAYHEKDPKKLQKIREIDRITKHSRIVKHPDDISAGTRVRLSLLLDAKERKERAGFGRHITNWSKEVYTVNRVNRHRNGFSATTYTLKEKPGVYYRHQLQPIPERLVPGKRAETAAVPVAKGKIVGLKEGARKKLVEVEDVPVVRLDRKKKKFFDEK